MAQPLTVLLVEDNPYDAELVVRELQRTGYAPTWVRVDTEADFRKRLEEGADLILSDYEMPQFNGLRALEILNRSGRDIPFILISGTIGEDTAVAAMKQGAADYLLKDRLTRLGQATAHALEQARLRQDRLIAERAVRSNAKFIEDILNSLPAAVVVVDQTGVITAVNEPWRRFAGENGGTDSLGQNYLTVCQNSIDRYNLPDAQAAADGIRSVLDGTQVSFSLEYSCHSPTQQRWFVMRVSPLSSVRHGAVIAHVDITNRKHSEEQLRGSEERFRQLAESIDEVFWMTDPLKGSLIYISPAYEKVWGRTCASLYAASHTWVDSLHPEDRERVRAAARSKQLRGDYDEIYRIVRPDGSVRWLHEKAFPVRNEAGVIYRMVGVAEDITEKRQLETQFFRAQRLESIGTLASGVAHDLNNILAPIMMAAPLIRQSKSGKEIEKMLTTIEASSLRGAQLVRQLLSFGRGVEGERSLLSIRPIVDEVMAIAQQTFPKNITLVVDVPADVWPIIGDGTQVHQVLLNLCVNARDAMPDGGTLTMALGNQQYDLAAASMIPGAKAADYTVMRVSDTGTGMTPEVIDKIFDPFFTTKETGKGTGLGLATVMGLVKSHGGFVTLSSELGKGSTFQVHWPAASREQSAEPKAASALSPMGQGELILVVDDEENIREAVTATLSRHGYRVLSAKDGVEGVMRFADADQEIKLVISDLDMPNMDGITMIQVMRKTNPALKVIVSSGIASGKHMNSRMHELHALGVRDLLAKPYTVNQILKAVHAKLTQ